MIKQTKLIFILLMTLLAGTVFGDTYTGVLSFDSADISFSAKSGYDMVSYKDDKVYHHYQPGAPYLPGYQFKVLIPSDMVVTNITVTGMSKKVVDWTFNAYPTQEMGNSEYTPPFTNPDGAIYGTNSQYPYGDAISYIGDSRIRGYKLAAFGVNLFSWNPVTEDLYFIENIEYTIEYEIAPPGSSSRNAVYSSTQNELFRDIVLSSVENSGSVDEFRDTTAPPPPGGSAGPQQIDLLIITSNAMKNDFINYARDRQKQTNLVTEVVTVEDIYSNYSESTNQLEIKRCIYDYVKNFNTNYVILGGDSEIVPDQDCYINLNNEYISTDMPTDLFYSCFDNNFTWDADGDGIVGETFDDADLTPDIFIGRLPFTTAGQVRDYHEKLTQYLSYAEKSDYKMKGILLTGAQLAVPGDAEERNELLYSEVINPRWQGNRKGSMYDSTNNLTIENMHNELQDYNAVHMVTHGSAISWSLHNFTSFQSSNALALRGNPIGVVATTACTTNAFDWDGGSCLGEAFILNPDGGSLVYIGASRVSWRSIGIQYTSDFFRNVLSDYDSNEHIGTTGAAFGLAKQNLAPHAEGGHSQSRWNHFALNFLGDPTIQFLEHKEYFWWERIRDFDATAIAAGADGTICALGDENYMNGSSVYKWNGANWDRLSGINAVALDVDPDGNPWAVSKSGTIYRWTGSYWQNLPGRAKDISVGGNGVVYIIDYYNGGSRGNYIAYWNGSSWVQINTIEAVSITVDGKGNPWVVDNTGRISRFNGSSWEDLPGKATDIAAAADGTVFITGYEPTYYGHYMYRWNDYDWQKIFGEAVQVEAGPDGMAFHVNNREDLYFGFPEENLIINGDFKLSHYNAWVKYDMEGGASTLSNVPEGDGHASQDQELKVSISSGGSEKWSVIVTQPHRTIEKGETYTVSFWARQANAGGQSISSDITVSLDAAPWTEYGAMSATFTEELKRYSFTFTMNHETDTDAVFQFCLGKIKRDVYIDNVSIVKVPKDTQLPSTPTDLYCDAEAYALNLSWDESLDNKGIKEYRIKCRNAKNEYTEFTTTDTSLTISGLLPWQNYMIFIKAVDHTGNESGEYYEKFRTAESPLPEWEANKTYYAGDWVQNQMLEWKALKTTTGNMPVGSPEFWEARN